MSVKCTKFSAWTWSPTMLFGISPKFEYICGKCGKYNTGWTAKVVTWHCQNIYLTQAGKSTFHKSHEASMTLKPYHVYCRSKWEF